MPVVWLLLAVWGAGAVLVAGRLALGSALVRSMVRRGRPLDGPEWRRALYEAADRLDLSTAPRLISSPRARMPFAFGLIRPVIVVPPGASSWSPERRRAVLLHELAHLRRFDLLLNTLGRLACAAWWPHPLAWVAVRRLRAESERACDDLVLSVGTRASEYADHLLQIVSAAEPARTPAAVLPLATRREFEGRVLAILERNLPRGAPRRPQVAAAAVAVLGLAVPLAAMAPTRAVRDDDIPSTSSATPDAPGPEPEHVDVGSEDIVQQNTRGEPLAGREEPTVEGDVARSPAVQRGDVAGPYEGGLVQDTPQTAVREALLQLLDDPVAEVRLEAVWALGDAADPASAAGLAGRLRDESAEVREMAGWALGEIADPESLSALAAALTGDADADVRAICAWALGEIADPAAAAPLARALADGSAEVRESAAWALGEIGPTGAPGALLRALEDESPAVRRVAAWALGQIEDPASAGPLAAAIRDADAEVREAALWALGRLDAEEVRPALIEALRSGDPAVRAAAARALSGRGGRPWPWPRPRPRIR